MKLKFKLREWLLGQMLKAACSMYVSWSFGMAHNGFGLGEGAEHKSLIEKPKFK